MKNELIELSQTDAVSINGGGLLYDLYRIIVEEKDDFIKGFKDGLENGIF